MKTVTEIALEDNERLRAVLKTVRDILDAPWEGESCADRLDHLANVLGRL